MFDIWGFRVQAIAGGNAKQEPTVASTAPTGNAGDDVVPAYVMRSVATAANVFDDAVLDIRVHNDVSTSLAFVTNCSSVLPPLPRDAGSAENDGEGKSSPPPRFRAELARTLLHPLSHGRRDVASYGSGRDSLCVHTSVARDKLLHDIVPRVAGELQDAAGVPRLRGACSRMGILWLLHRSGVNFR